MNLDSSSVICPDPSPKSLLQLTLKRLSYSSGSNPSPTLFDDNDKSQGFRGTSIKGADQKGAVDDNIFSEDPLDFENSNSPPQLFHKAIKSSQTRDSTTEITVTHFRNEDRTV